jgi:hypothetical protein
LLTQKFLEAVEDEIEAELVLLAVVVAGLEYVLTGQLGEARVLLCGNCSRKAFASSEVSSGVPNARLPSCSANP